MTKNAVIASIVGAFKEIPFKSCPKCHCGPDANECEDEYGNMCDNCMNASDGSHRAIDEHGHGVGASDTLRCGLCAKLVPNNGEYLQLWHFIKKHGGWSPDGHCMTCGWEDRDVAPISALGVHGLKDLTEARAFHRETCPILTHSEALYEFDEYPV